MIDTKRKEELSYAYLLAVCAPKGIAVERQHHDDDSIDVIIKRKIVFKDNSCFNVALGVQLKATSIELKKGNGYVSYDLPVKNYNDICTIGTMKICLCVLELPSEIDKCVVCDTEKLMLHYRMYWHLLDDVPKTDNRTTIRLKIPDTNLLTPTTVMELVQRIAEESKYGNTDRTISR